jgi:hypothetical protein
VRRGRKILFIGLLLVGLATLLWFRLKSSSQLQSTTSSGTLAPSPAPKALQSQQTPPPATQPIEERRKTVVKEIQDVLAIQITFYGKVIDQNDVPVPDATINYGALDKFDAHGSQYQGKSNVNGEFSINGIQGAVLRVGVQKQGYYKVDGKSSAAFAYGVGPDNTRSEPPTKGEPAVFVLQKMGVTEPLIKVGSRQVNIPKTGQPLGLDLSTGQTGYGNLQIESSLGNISRKPFDWRFRLSVPGGGLVERKGRFDFEAPASDYQESVEVKMPAIAEQWSLRVTKEYFAKLSDGRYARFSIRFYPGDRNFVVIESYVNPTTGSRNLEFDPSKVVKSK